jgi:polyferredoxin
MKLQVKRLFAQFFFLLTANLGFLNIKTGFCYPFFYCHACPTANAACPLRSLEISVFRGNFNWRFFFFPLLIFGVVGVVSGRAVCGWACPIGLLQRGTGVVAKKIQKYPLINRLGKHKIEPYLRYLKYITLLGLVIITPILIGFMFTDICPVGFLTGTIPISLLEPGKYVPSSFYYLAFIVFILFLILIFTIERGWCRYFCPVGALLAPFNKISLLHLSVNKKECIHCNACSNVCPMGIDVPNMNRDPECILCGKCVKVCPKNIISFQRM